jgi:transcriptional regulator with XRE-family HTH domain
LRLLRGMTQAELADRLGICEALIAPFENGSSMPNLPFLERIAKALDAQVEIKIIPKALQP